MADINIISPDGITEYGLEDTVARNSLTTLNGMIGTANGIAELDANGKVPSSQLPSYVDDVLEYASTSSFPATGETGKIYVALDTNKTYRWGGSDYVEISESLALGETSSTAYAGNKGKANADAIAAIKDGSSIDSFSDVETALEGKISKSQTAGLVKNDGTIDTTTVGKVTAIEGKIPSSASSSNKLATADDVASCVPWSANAVLGAKNILTYPYYDSTNTASNITFTVNADGSVGISNGTASGERRFNILHRTNDFHPDAGRYKVSFDGTYYSGIACIIEAWNGSTYVKGLGTFNYADHAEKEINIDYNGYDRVALYILVQNGTVISNATTIYPMLRLAADTDPTYAPPAMTNQQLTEQKANKIDTANVVARADVAANTSFTFNGENGHSYIVLGDHPYNNNGFMSIVDLFTSAGSVTDIKTAASVTVTQSNNVITVAVTSGVWVKIIDLGYFK